MDSEPYDVWMSIYNDEIRGTYESERSELRKILMIYRAFEVELNNLKNHLSNEVSEIKTKLRRKDFQQKCENFAGLAASERFEINSDINKENSIPEIVPYNPNSEISEDYSIESPNTSEFFQCNVLPASSNEIASTAMNKNWPIINSKRYAANQSTIYHPIVTHRLSKTETSKKKTDECSTPKNADDTNIMECSIIENTPDIKCCKNIKPYKLSQRKSSKKIKSSQSKQKQTLTQMFYEPKKRKIREIDSNGPSMSINAMIDLINQSSDSDTEADLDKSDLDIPAAEDPKNHLQSFVENYNKVPKMKKETCPDFGCNEVVRGKERKKLKGWSCEDCENYYKGLNLSPDELERRKDECSKHRYKFNPREDTYQGFWDLSFGPSPKTQHVEKSMVFSFKKT